ncbi:MAG: hypothetical protein P8174_01730 [Gemmatimonadota bacterium]
MTHAKRLFGIGRTGLGVAVLAAFALAALSACGDSSGPDNVGNQAQDKILFVSDRGGQTGDTGTPLTDIYAMNADGSEMTNLTEAPAVTYRELRPSPDHGKLVFESDRSGCYNIWVVNVDGTEATQLTGAAGERCSETPRWSPDGSKITFQTSRESIDRSWEVYVMNADGSDPHNVSDNGGVTETAWDFSHGWTPDGKVVFHHVISSFETYVVNADGTELQPLFADTGNYAPFWSPDGSKVAFVSERDGNAEIHMMNADGTGVQNLTNDSAADTFEGLDNNSSIDPWSPDGSMLAFTSQRDGNREIYVMSADGTGLVNVTNDPGEDWFDGWSPDGSKMLFTSDRGGTKDIYVVNADGTGLVRLTDGTANSWDAVWVPRS